MALRQTQSLLPRLSALRCLASQAQAAQGEHDVSDLSYMAWFSIAIVNGAT